MLCLSDTLNRFNSVPSLTLTMAKLLITSPNDISVHSLNIRFHKQDEHHTQFALDNAKFQRFADPILCQRTDLQEIFEGRLHTLMGWSSHTVDDWQA